MEAQDLKSEIEVLKKSNIQKTQSLLAYKDSMKLKDERIQDLEKELKSFSEKVDSKFKAKMEKLNEEISRRDIIINELKSIGPVVLFPRN